MIRRTTWTIVVFSAMLATSAAADLPGGVLNEAGFQGGVILHLGCGDGRWTAGLAANENCLVQGLNTDATRVAAAREHLQKLGLYGRVAIDRFDGRRLPFTDNLVNLIVTEGLGEVAEEEAMRVLAPGGVLCVKKDGGWSKRVKPRPTTIDEWTHYMYDASGNAVAHDEVVGPPGALQWVAGPRYMRSHEHVPGIYCVVSSGGRIFYLQDEAATGAIRATPQWYLIARDAFNGTLLWKKPIGKWYPHIINWGQTPQQLQRKLVAVGDRVYVTLGLHAPLTAVDAVTGELVRTYEKTRGAEEIVLDDGVLLAMVRSVTDERIKELDKWVKLVGQAGSPLDSRDSAEPLIKRLRATERQGETSLSAFDAASGRMLWSKSDKELEGYRMMSLRASGDVAFYQQGQAIVCVDLADGQKRWETQSSVLKLIHGDAVYCAGGNSIEALSVASGEKLWSQKPLLVSIHDVFLAGGSLWICGFKPSPGERGPSWGPLFFTERDPATGDVLRHIEPVDPSHHHRCYQNKATDRFILGGRRGTEFVDLDSGEVLWNSWVRGVCRYGVMPANGLLYAPPHACGCYSTVKTTGFVAIGPRELPARSEPTHAGIPERGPAFDGPAAVSNLQADTWPTYRQNAERSGATAAAVPASLKIAWRSQVGDRLSAPTVAGGKVFVADVDGHRVCALDAASGDAAWQFTTGARVDSPPTIHNGRAIFGSRDGYVYSARTADGVLAWRLLAAREDRRVAVRGQLESVSPSHGSVLVRDGAILAIAGRSSYMDGGLDLCRIDPRSGELLSCQNVFSPDPESGRQPEQYDPNGMPGSRNDILSADDEYLYLQDGALADDGVEKAGGNPHLFAVTGFLDDAWPHRSYLIYGKKSSMATGCSGRDRKLTYGRLLTLDDATVFGYGRTTVHWSDQLEDGPYRLFAVPREGGEKRWSVEVPVYVRAMLKAGDTLFVAGAASASGEKSGTPSESDTGRLLAISAADGSVLAKVTLDASPVFDGMAAAGGALYMALGDGSVVCLKGEGR